MAQSFILKQYSKPQSSNFAEVLICCNTSLSLFLLNKFIRTFLNQFSINFPLLYLLKTSETQKFSNVFSRYKSGTSVENELIIPLQRGLYHKFYLKKYFRSSSGPEMLKDTLPWKTKKVQKQPPEVFCKKRCS